jgi:hypothetical protein
MRQADAAVGNGRLGLPSQDGPECGGLDDASAAARDAEAGDGGLGHSGREADTGHDAVQADTAAGAAGRRVAPLRTAGVAAALAAAGPLGLVVDEAALLRLLGVATG